MAKFESVGWLVSVLGFANMTLLKRKISNITSFFLSLFCLSKYIYIYNIYIFIHRCLLVESLPGSLDKSISLREAHVNTTNNEATHQVSSSGGAKPSCSQDDHGFLDTLKLFNQCLCWSTLLTELTRLLEVNRMDTARLHPSPQELRNAFQNTPPQKKRRRVDSRHPGTREWRLLVNWAVQK